MHPFRRSAIACVLAPCVVLSPVVLPEHLHEADPEHPHVVVHRHFESHDHDEAGISEREGRVVWLAAAAIQPATDQLTVSLAVRPAGFESVPPAGRAVATTLEEAAPPHGPPRSELALRGPPSLSL